MIQKLVQSNHPYIALRGSTFYFRFAFPLHLRSLCPWLPFEVKRSLRTDSYTEALVMVNSKLSIIKLLKVCIDADKVRVLYSALVDFTDQLRLRVSTEFSVGALKEVELLDKVSTTPKLSEVWKGFVKWKSWTERRASENQRRFANLLYFLGDVPVDTVTKVHLKTALSAISGLPVRNKSPYRKMSLDAIVSTDIPEEDLLSSKSVKEHLKLAQGLFNSYLVRELDVLKKSPTEGLRWDVEDNRYACLTDAQVRRVLNKAKSKPKWFWWFLMIALW